MNRSEHLVTATPDDRQLLILENREIEFLKDALWCACLAEQLATSESAEWQRAFLADLHALLQSREAQGKAGFRDLFLELVGTPLADLPPSIRQQLEEGSADLPTESDTLKLVGALRLEIGHLYQELAEARQMLAAQETRQSRRSWWPFRRQSG